MSAIRKLKEQIRTKKQQQHQEHFQKTLPPPPGGNRRTAAPEQPPSPPRKKRKKGPIQIVEKEVFPEKSKKKKKAKKTHNFLPERFYDSSDEEEDEKEEKPKAWNPPEIMQNLKNEAVVRNVPMIIASIKGEENSDKPKKIVWDHGETAKGKKSDQHLFQWLQAYSAYECIRKRAKNDIIFSDGLPPPTSAPPLAVKPKRGLKIK